MPEIKVCVFNALFLFLVNHIFKGFSSTENLKSNKDTEENLSMFLRTTYKRKITVTQYKMYYVRETLNVDS